MSISLGSKKEKLCVTCLYWQGKSAQVHSVHHIKYDSSESAKCTKTGFNKKSWCSCNQHKCRLDFE